MLKQQFIRHQAYKWEVLKKLALFFDMINTKNLSSSLLKVCKKSYKDIYFKNDIYFIRYITMKNFDYGNIHSANILYLVISKVDRYIERTMEINTQFLFLQMRTKKY